MQKNKIALILLLLSFLGCVKDKQTTLPTYTVQRRDFYHHVVETGELEAVRSVTLSTPMISWHVATPKIVRLVEDGKQVQEGDVLVEFDKTEVQKSMDDAKAELEISRAELRKAVTSQVSQIEELETELEKSTLQHRISELELERSTFEAEIDRKQIELDLKRAAINLEKARQEIKNQKRIHQEELNKLKLKVEQLEARLEETRETLENLTLRAPSPGIAIIQKNRATGSKFQVDDQPWRRTAIVGLPDLSEMQALIQVNEVDIAKIAVGQESRIRLESYPDTSFAGTVTHVSALARDKERESRIKVFDVKILLGQQDRRLLPGMSVTVKIKVEHIPDTLSVPLESVFQTEKGPVVYKKTSGGFSSQPVTLGSESDDFVVVTAGLLTGDQIALQRPEEQKDVIHQTAGETR
jgi:RND family efflux transporter MFP subunit